MTMNNEIVNVEPECVSRKQCIMFYHTKYKGNIKLIIINCNGIGSNVFNWSSLMLLIVVT